MLISKEMKLMRHLNNAERRAVRAHRILTHAFYCLPADDRSGGLLLQKRWESFSELPADSHHKVRLVTMLIENMNWQRWCDEASEAGLR